MHLILDLTVYLQLLHDLCTYPLTYLAEGVSLLRPSGHLTSPWKDLHMITHHKICKGTDSSPPEQNSRHFADDHFRCIFVNEDFFIFLAATKQLYEWFSPSVCPSVRPSVTPFWLCSHHPIIMKFSGVITSDKSDVHAKGQGQRSKVKVTEVTTQLNRFRTVTPVWIHIWWWDDAYSLIMLRRGALLFFKVIRQISRSHGSKNRWIWPRLGVSGL